MTATDELRRLLTERGVKYGGGDTVVYFEDERGYKVSAYDAPRRYGDCILCVCHTATPEQAIAATLGAGTCELHDCEGSFSAVNKPVWRCDCGAFMTQYTDATAYHKPRYCPNCGKRVKE